MIEKTFNNLKFYIYTKIINRSLKNKNFTTVEFFLKKKKELAKKMRNEKIN